MLLVKIPKELVDEFGVKNGASLMVKIKTDGELYRGPLRVTSGFELYLPKNLREILARKKSFRIAIQGSRK